MAIAAVPYTQTGTLEYAPASNFNGADSFDFKTNDGFSDSLPATVSITVTPVDDVPGRHRQRLHHR